jgi:hypothetical protein
MKKEHEDGSELHRLKPMREDYDPQEFNRLYKLCRPVIKNLVRQIDCSRYKLTPDILISYFYDKMLYVFNKYYGTCSEDHLQARILSSLRTYKNKILRAAYGEMAEFNQSQESFEVLFDNNKEDEFFDDDSAYVREELFQKVEGYMNSHLSSDAKLIFEILYNPPECLEDKFTSTGKITNMSILEFFEMPRTKSSVKYISELRKDIAYWLERAKIDLR